jgi:hypothetical protein
MVSFGCQPVHIQADHILWAGVNAQIAPLAVSIINFNPSLDGHSLTSSPFLNPWTLFDIFYLYYQYKYITG